MRQLLVDGYVDPEIPRIGIGVEHPDRVQVTTGHRARDYSRETQPRAAHDIAASRHETCDVGTGATGHMQLKAEVQVRPRQGHPGRSAARHRDVRSVDADLAVAGGGTVAVAGTGPCGLGGLGGSPGPE